MNAPIATQPPIWFTKVMRAFVVAFVLLIVIAIVAGISAEDETGPTRASSTTLPPAVSFNQSEFSTFVSQNFGDVEWLQFVSRMYASGSALWIETSLFKDQDAYEPARQMCVAASMFIVSDSLTRFESLTIRSSSGERLILRNQLISSPNSSSCEPEI